MTVGDGVVPLSCPERDSQVGAQIYDVDYFIAKFEAIPEERWCADLFVNFSGQRCVMGHCGVGSRMLSAVAIPVLNPEASALADLFGGYDTVVDINNGASDTFRQPTPRSRILAALKTIKEKQTK